MPNDDMIKQTGQTYAELVRREDLQATIPKQHTIDADTIFMIQLMAPSFYLSRLYPTIASEHQAIALMLKAAGLGIPPTSAFDFFDIIEGKPTLKPVGAMALIHQSGRVDIEIENDNDKWCRVKMTRRDNGNSHEVIYTIEEAIASNLVKDASSKPNAAWNRFRRDMLRNRAIGRCARIACPDIIGGMYLTTELEQTSSDYDPKVMRLSTPNECDHMAACNTDTHCPQCGVKL